MLESSNEGLTGTNVDKGLPLPSNAARGSIQPATNTLQLDSEHLAQVSLLDANPTNTTTDLASEDQTNFDLFVRTSNLTFFSNEEFGDLDFFELLPGLPPNQIPQFAFPNNSGGFDGFSPLEQSNVFGQSSTEEPRVTTEMPQQVIPEEPHQEIESRPREAPMNIAENRNPSLPDSINMRLPRVVQEVPAKQPKLIFNDTMRTALTSDLSCLLSPEQSRTLSLMSSTSLQKCLRTYVDCFHIHLPVFHLHTFDLGNTPSPLLLAMCAIGALFRLERKVAASLYGKADQALQSVLLNTHNDVASPNFLEDWIQPRRDSTTSTRRPVWVTQCKLLLTFFAAFSGDSVVIRRAIEGVGMLSSVLNIRSSAMPWD